MLQAVYHQEFVHKLHIQSQDQVQQLLEYHTTGCHTSHAYQHVLKFLQMYSTRTDGQEVDEDGRCEQTVHPIAGKPGIQEIRNKEEKSG